MKKILPALFFALICFLYAEPLLASYSIEELQINLSYESLQTSRINSSGQMLVYVKQPGDNYEIYYSDDYSDPNRGFWHNAPKRGIPNFIKINDVYWQCVAVCLSSVR